ncbi:MAG TPA: hypothetical protein VG897_18750, partial [Terriglobales bacterium]|nr:hypothetical protein [Terriglobales bacterium]
FYFSPIISPGVHMPESWEREYARFFWAIVILAPVALIGANCYQSFSAGSFTTDIASGLKHYGIPAATFSLVTAIAIRWKPLKDWKRRRAVNEVIVAASVVFFGFTIPAWMVGWEVSNVIALLVCTVILLVIGLAITTAEQSKATRAE